MKLSFFASQSGVVLAAAGMVLAEVAAGIMITSPALANASAAQFPNQADSLELADQPSENQIALDDDMDDDDIESLPESVSEAILKDVSRESGSQVSNLRVVKVERQRWVDGCLGLGDADTVCTQALVPGWLVVVSNGEQNWVYRTNASGSMVKLDAEATQIASRRLTLETITRRQVTTTRRTTEATQAVSGSASSQSTQVTGVVGGAASSQNTQVTGGGASSRTQQQTVAARSSSVQVSFPDVPQGYWAREFIVELAQRGILTGFPDGSFRPNEPVTRAQFAALVTSIFEMSEVRNTMNFRDVSTSHWAYYGIQEAYKMGFLDVVSGSQFNPNQSMSRLQIVTALAKGLNYSSSTSIEQVLQFYSDATAIPASARSLVAAATEQGIVVNYPNVKTFAPNMVATRAEVAAFIYQAMVSTNKMAAISSPYVVSTQTQVSPAPARPANETGESDRTKPKPQNCNQGIGNGAEGCDPGRSQPHGGSNDEGGRTPGNRPR